MGGHRRKLKRYDGLGDARFLTCSCYHRLGLFNNNAIKDRFSSSLSDAMKRLEFKLYAWVLMPEHFHLLVRPRGVDQDGGQILRGLKSGFARIVLARWRILQAPILPRLVDASGHHRFWQPGGGYDRNIRDEEEFRQKLNYIHLNPVKRGLVEKPSQWAWSSARWYDEQEDYVGPPIDPWPW